MTRTHYSPELKDQIILRVKEDGVKVSDVAEQHGIKPELIYKWIAKRYKDPNGNNLALENSRLKRQNEELLKMIGQLTLEKEMVKKKRDNQY